MRIIYFSYEAKSDSISCRLVKLLTKYLFLNLKVVSFSIVTFVISVCYQLKYMNLGLSLILPSFVLALTFLVPGSLFTQEN